MEVAHEKLFEAWPLLRDYVADNRKQLMDKALLESRAEKWAEMKRPWFDGLASGREREKGVLGVTFGCSVLGTTTGSGGVPVRVFAYCA